MFKKIKQFTAVSRNRYSYILKYRYVIIKLGQQYILTILSKIKAMNGILSTSTAIVDLFLCFHSSSLIYSPEKQVMTVRGSSRAGAMQHGRLEGKGASIKTSLFLCMSKSAFSSSRICHLQIH